MGPFIKYGFMAEADVRVSEYGFRNSYHHQMSYKDYLKKVIIAKLYTKSYTTLFVTSSMY